MKEQYKLYICISWYKSKKVTNSITKSFVWDNKDDALACKKLLEKAEYSQASIDIGFVKFVADEPI